MTSTRLNLAVIGGFVLLALVSLIVSLAVLAGRTGASDDYSVVYGNVAGLKYGSPVLYEGYPVGQVTAIKPLFDAGKVRFRVTLAIARGWKIPTDSVASTTAGGLLAPMTIAIKAGSSATLLNPGDEIAAGSNRDLFATVAGAASTVDKLANEALLPLFGNLDRQVTAVGTLLDDDVRKLVGNANRIAEAAAQTMPPLLADARAVTANLARVSQQIDGAITPERLAAIDRIIANADQATASLAKSSKALEALSGDSGDDLRIAVRELRLTSESLARHSDAITQNLDSAAHNLKDLSRQLRANPSLLLRAPDEEVEAEGGR
ncbi:MlaD family protein [Nevskia sp.]|uniref:MlaD family protein n=1 Tax=Nevskia sp. TaxID=1929292 RepID=UPI0025DF76D7|nr:MlaD family protein [Nevskia sp.]